MPLTRDFKETVQARGRAAQGQVAGAAANELPDQIPEPVKQERLERFMGRYT